MSKQNGLGDGLIVAGHDVSGDIGAVDKISGPIAVLEVTGLPKKAFERIGGLRDGGIDFTAYFNPDPLDPNGAGAHSIFAPLPTADVLVTYLRGVGLGLPAACEVAKQLDYAGKRGNDGAFTFSVSTQCNGYGVEWGIQATPGKRGDVAATDGASLDGGAATAFGLQAYLQVFSFTGVSATIKLQDSADNVTFADVAGGSFGAQTGLGAARIQTGRTAAVRRYVRVSTTGTFSECTFLVALVRNDIRTDF